MPNLPSAIQGSAPLELPFDKSIRFPSGQKGNSSWLLNTSPSRIDALKSIRLTLPESRNASTTAHRQLKNAIQPAGTTQNNVDKALLNLQDISTFAKPLLQKALKDRFGIEAMSSKLGWALCPGEEAAWWVHDFR